jgi:hypothetical protein
MTGWLTRNEAVELIGAESVRDAAAAQVVLAHLQGAEDVRGRPGSFEYSRAAVERIAEEIRAKEMSRALGGHSAGPLDRVEVSNLPSRRADDLTYGPGLKAGDTAYVDKYGTARAGDDPDEYCPAARVAHADKDGWVVLEALDAEVPF